MSTPTITPEKLDLFKTWYHTALDQANKASEIDLVSYYDGVADGMKATLDALYSKSNNVVEVSKRSGGMSKPLVIVVAFGGAYYVYKNQTKVKNFFKRSKETLNDAKDTATEKVQEQTDKLKTEHESFKDAKPQGNPT